MGLRSLRLCKSNSGSNWMAKKDGKLGPDLTESQSGDCATDPSNPSVAESRKLLRLECGNIAAYPGQIRAIKVPLAGLTPWLSRLLARKVIDKTGLSGDFDIVLKWNAQETQAIQLGPDAPTSPSPESMDPSIFTAIQERLGLDLIRRGGAWRSS